MWSVDNLPWVAFPRTQDPHMRYQPHVVSPRPQVAYPHKQNMQYQPHVVFPWPWVAYPHRQHMRYQPHEAFPQPWVALPQLHHLQHMRYWPHMALPQPWVALPQLQDTLYMWYWLHVAFPQPRVASRSYIANTTPLGTCPIAQARVNSCPQQRWHVKHTALALATGQGGYGL